VNSELRPRTIIPWLPRRLKEALAHLAIPLARGALRLVPFVGAKEAIWDLLVGPHLWWRPYAFTARTRFGPQIAGNTVDYIQKYLYYFGIWEPNLTGWIVERLKPGDAFVDVGANVGYFSLLAAKLVGPRGRVVAIEASPEVFKLLRRNLELNRAYNVRAVNVAISDREGRAQLYPGPKGNLGKTTVAKDWAQKENLKLGTTVRTLPLPAVLEEDEIKAVRLIKIDVEGHEWEVISGMVSVLESCRPETEVFVEVNPAALLAQGKTCEDFISMFTLRGFHAYRLINDYEPKSYLRCNRVRPTRLSETSFASTEDLVFSRIDAEAV